MTVPPGCLPGRPAPLGATWDGEGTNFALFSQHAHGVQLCLFDEHGGERRIPLQESTYRVWHGYLPGVAPGQRYGYRVSGPFSPEHGLRFNPDKLLVDPYARAIDGELILHDAIYGFPPGREDHVRDVADSAPYVPKSVVVHDNFPWGDDRRPAVPWAQSVVYELHVKGMTARHPDVPPELRGTYTGLCHPAVLEHLTSLGVTAVELLPVHHFVSEPAISRRGLKNYWGYNTLGFFAPHAGYAAGSSTGDQVTEFKAMVRGLHQAGIEVILDVVYNHTAEGDQCGPTLSLRGIDNSSYYRLRQDDRRRYVDFTGCGNTVDARQPRVLQLLMDSLRYWVTEMHVDGFRFDLASALARSAHDVDLLSPFLTAVAQDPVLAQVKLIAEPWDLGHGGYQVGGFPAPWAEWNGRFRDSVRDFWRGADSAEGTVAELARRLSGSADLYAAGGRRPFSSINFVTAHDGFPLRDLVSYNAKHNEANGEDNRDGENHNRSWNCGVEGPTDDPDITALRQRQIRNLMATLLLSAGVPMLTAGDELGRTQGGNNNAYCQDNEVSWLDWDLGPAGADLLAFTREILALRRRHPVLRSEQFFRGEPEHERSELKDLAWFSPGGEQMTVADWAPASRTLGMFLWGGGVRAPGAGGQPGVDDSFLLLLHASDGPVQFTLPGQPWANAYTVVVDTGAAGQADAGSAAGQADAETATGRLHPAGTAVTLPARSLMLLRVAAADART